MQAILGKKLNQTQKFLTDGTRIPVTIVDVAGNTVLQVKSLDTDGYAAVQLGYGVKKHPTKPMIGHAKKAGVTKVPRHIKEVRLTADNTDLPTLGEVLALETVFQPGDIVQVTGTSKGKGFAGVVKRHNFRGGPRTHGQSDRERAPGSIGQTTTPGRVYRGKRMAGRMGQDTVTIKNLVVVDVDAANNQVFLKGLVPGSKNTIIYIEKTGEIKEKNYVPLYKPEPEVVDESPAVEAAAAEEAVAVEGAQSEAPAQPAEAASTPEEGEPAASEEKKGEDNA